VGICVNSLSHLRHPWIVIIPKTNIGVRLWFWTVLQKQTKTKKQTSIQTKQKEEKNTSNILVFVKSKKI